MLPGVVPFPPEFAQRYRARGYWQDKSLAEEFSVVFRKFQDRIALIDGERRYTYGEIDELTDNLALNLLELGLNPLDRVVPTLPNIAEFVLLYFALQKIGAIPIAALATHRFAEINQFVQLSGATACFYPERQGDFAFEPMIRRVQAANPHLNHCVSLPRLQDLIHRKARLAADELRKVRIDPADPCIFQLSGGTTGIPKLIPRTHNDYAYNSRTAAPVCAVTGDSVLLLALPIAHNLPLACPGVQGYFFQGGKVVLSPNTRPADLFTLIQQHRVTHIKVVPALLVRMINDPSLPGFDLSSLRLIQSGGQRMQPEVRVRTRELIPSAFVQENFGMSEGMLLFVRLDDPQEVKLDTCGRPISPDDEVKLVDDDGREVADGEVGELTCRGPYTLRGYFGVPEYNARQFTADGFYRSGDLMRRHPSGNYVVEGRKKDLINRGGEKISAEEIENLILTHPCVQNVACVPIPDPDLGERMCACLILKPGRQLALAELVEFLKDKEIAKFKLPERLYVCDDFPVSAFGKVSKKTLSELAERHAHH
ncbi:MAG TPA: AMP-binding protein [Burkholderiales bacterium]|jgi:2,3-dihydroxybenzoate-AMP ligase|nr:AMP-binding protein [Burkholderiales bacterium]